MEIPTPESHPHTAASRHWGEVGKPPSSFPQTTSRKKHTKKETLTSTLTFHPLNPLNELCCIIGNDITPTLHLQAITGTLNCKTKPELTTHPPCAHPQNRHPKTTLPRHSRGTQSHLSRISLPCRAICAQHQAPLLISRPQRNLTSPRQLDCHLLNTQITPAPQRHPQLCPQKCALLPASCLSSLHLPTQPSSHTMTLPTCARLRLAPSAKMVMPQCWKPLMMILWTWCQLH